MTYFSHATLDAVTHHYHEVVIHYIYIRILKDDVIKVFFSPIELYNFVIRKPKSKKIVG
jgi:hypothetical protein